MSPARSVARAPSARLSPRRTGVLACVAAAALAAAPAAAALSPGDPVRLTTKTIDGQLATIDDYAGKLLVVHFWASWHEPSVRQLQTLRAILDHTADLGVAMLGICLDAPDDEASVSTGSQATALERLAEAIPNDTASAYPWDHAFAQSQVPALDTRFFREPYAIPSVWVVAPDGTALWQGHPNDLPEQLLGFLESHPPTALPEPTTDAAEAGEDEVDAEASETELDADALAEAMIAEALAMQSTAGQEIDAAEALAAQAEREAAVVRAKAFLLNAEAAWTDAPFRAEDVLVALSAIEPATHEVPLIAAHGQRWERLLKSMDADQRAAFIVARDTLPEAGFAVDAFLETTGDVDAMDGRPMADAGRVASQVARAQRDAARGNDAEAYKKFLAVVGIGAGLPEADDALIAVLRYETDTILMQEIALAERTMEAEGMLFRASGMAAGFREEEAAEVLREILTDYADTPVAAQAQEMLDGLDLPD